MADTKLKAKSRAKPAVAAAAITAVAGAAAATAARASKKEKGMMNMQNEATEKAAEGVQALFGDMNARAKAATEKSQKIVEELTDLARGNVEALVASSKVAAKGAEAIGQEAAEYGRKSFEEASAALRSLSEAKTPADFFRIQSEFAKSAFDGFVAESAKVSETMVKLAGDVAEPITSRYSLAAERVKGLAA
jgi:phasin family protein